MQKITLIFQKDNGQSIELDFHEELHLMITGLPENKREMIVEAIRGQLQAMPDTEVVEITGNIAVSQKKSMLQDILQELQTRYCTMADLGMKTIVDYNQVSAGKWNYIVVLIDYHPVSGNDDEVDDLICKLAQKGRAAGIHLILNAAKTPSLMVCANFPARFVGNTAPEIAKGLSENEVGLFYSYGKKGEKRIWD